MNARLASRAGRLRRRTSVRRLDQMAGAEVSGLENTLQHASEDASATGARYPDHDTFEGKLHRPAAGTLLAFARETYNLRRRRARFLPADLFGEPTWDILLDLYVATREKRSVPTTSACIGAHVPPTTALRWLRILETRGLVEREEDGRDGRRTFVRLSEQGLAAMDDWLRMALANLGQAVGSSLQPGGLRHLPLAEAAE